MQTIESILQRITAGSGASIWLALYYGFLLLLLGLLVLAVLNRRIMPFLIALAQEDPKATTARKVRVAWGFATFLSPIFIFCRIEGYTTNLPYRLAASIFFFALVFVGTEIALLLIFQTLFRRLLQVKVSAIFKDLFRMVVYVLALVSIVRTVFGIEDIGTLVAVSSAASIIVGLALQDTLGSIFAGLFLQVDAPISLGDWVLLEGEEGQVVELTWFSTKIITRENQLVSIPNRRVAHAVIKNFSRPTAPLMIHKRIGISYDAPPCQVKDVLIAHMGQVAGVLKDPEPNVFLVEFADSAVTYELRFWIDDLRRWSAISDAVMTGAWYHLRRAEMTIPFPIRTVHLRREVREDPKLHRVVSVLVKVDFLAPLEPTELEIVAGQLKHQLYARGERVFLQGDAGETFYIIWSGAVSVRTMKDGHEVTLARLSRGEYFGEMSLLTGEPRRATIVAEEDTDLLCLDRPAFGILIARNPGIAERMSQILAHRLAETQSRLEEHEKDTLIRRRTHTTSEESMYGKILAGIRTIFGV